MAEVLVLAEHVEGTLKKVTGELVTAARALGEPSVVVTGPSGTAAGVGMGFKPPRYLKAGDVVRIEIDGIGVIENRFA